MFPFGNLFHDTRRQRRRAVPPSTFSSVQLALAYLLEQTPGGTLVQIDRRQQGAGEGAEIDGQIEPAEHPTEQVAVACAELVANVSRDAGFDHGTSA